MNDSWFPGRVGLLTSATAVLEYDPGCEQAKGRAGYRPVSEDIVPDRIVPEAKRTAMHYLSAAGVTRTA